MVVELIILLKNITGGNSIGGGKKGHDWSELQPKWNDAFALYQTYNKKQLTTKLKNREVPDTVMKQAEFNKQADAFLNKGKVDPQQQHLSLENIWDYY